MSKAKRINVTVPKAPAKEDMVEALKQVAAATIRVEKMQAKAAEKIESAKAALEAESAAWRLQIETGTAVVQAWAEANEAEFGKAKSMTVYGGHTIGWHTGQPQVALAKLPRGEGRNSWERVIDRARAAGEALARFLRPKVEVDKPVILAAARTEGKTEEEIIRDLADLETLRVEVVQEERFFIKLDNAAAAGEVAA